MAEYSEQLYTSLNAGTIPNHKTCRLLSPLHLEEALALLVARGAVIIVTQPGLLEILSIVDQNNYRPS